MEGIKVNKETGAVELKTAHGILILEPFADEDYPAFNINFKLDGHEDDPVVPICMVEDACPADGATSETPNNAVVVRVYGDCDSDEYTHRVDIPMSEIEGAYQD